MSTTEPAYTDIDNPPSTAARPGHYWYWGPGRWVEGEYTEQELARYRGHGNGQASQHHDDAGLTSWDAVDLTAVLDGTWTPPEPTVGRRTDKVALFYSGKTHTVVSESEGGKTWLALSAALDELRDGHHVVYIDFEDSEGGVVGRLLIMGADHEQIRDQFHYLRPVEPLGDGIRRDRLNKLLTTHQPTLAIIDGVTEAMVLHGLEPLSNKDVATFGRLLPDVIVATGAAVVSLDHVVKDREGRGRYALGAVHKLNSVDGAAYTLENKTPFGIGVTGKSRVYIAKDRPGQLRRHALPGKGGLAWFGDLVVTSQSEQFADVAIEPPHEQDETFRPTHMMERISKALEQHGPLSGKRIEAAVTGRAASIRQAVDYLILDGYVSDGTPHALLRPYPGGDTQ